MCKFNLIFFTNFLISIIFIFVYFFIYNLTLIGVFFFFFKFINFKNKTLYSLNNYKINLFSIFSLTIFFFSMAGIPPFVGFFTKLLILISLLNTNINVAVFFFFFLLMLGLYFYLQNIKYIHTTSTINTAASFHIFQIFNFSIYYYFFILLILNLTFGIFFFDDLILFFFWLWI